MSVAVVDNGGFIVLIERMDHARPRPAAAGLHVYLVGSDDHISWARPMSVHERWNSGLGLRRPAGMGRAWAKMQRCP